MKKYIILTLLILNGSLLKAQEQSTEAHTEKFRHNQIGIMLGHTHMRDGSINNKNKRLSLPSYTLFYNYHFNEKWTLGLDVDWVTEEFISTGLLDDSKTVKRSNPVAPAAMLGYKPGAHFTFLAGAGADIDKDDKYVLIRLAIEYGLEIRKGWEFITNLGYDNRINGYGSLQLAVGMSYNF